MKKTADTAQKEAHSKKVEEQTPGEQADLALTTGNAPIDPALAMADQSGALLLSPEDLFDPETIPLGLGDPTKEDIALLVNPDLTLVSPDASQSPLASLAAGAPADALVGPLAVINQAALGQVGSTAAINSPLTAAQPLAAAGGLAGELAGDVSDNLTLEPAPGADTDGEPSGAADNGENPDFLLLNSKAALNKLTDANTTAPAQDKATVDLAKPTVIGAAVESLTRLTEAQSPAARAFVVQTGVPVTVGSPQWSQAVGDKVLWLAAQNVSAAEIRLDPPELGPMQVRVSINQDQASVTFTSPHPVVREALDQQLNRLREMFSEQGLNLVNVDVSDKSFAQQEREQQESGENQATAEVDEEDLVPVGVSQAISMRLVDHYA
ncbi:MAG TPA: flagellar hook-length control protein FliK [Cellvibrio sp.]|nr:flagellar hook-length control protein FliK [Cellvibrio sp.]